MYEITNRQQAPYSSICYVRCEWEWVDERGIAQHAATRASGVIVGYNDVLTALHVVYDVARGGWAHQVTIYPAADTSPSFTTPFGSHSDVGSIEGMAANWDLDGDGLLTEQESAGDFALLGLRSRLGDATGWLPVAKMPGDFSGLMVGYPARGTGMMAESVFADASSSDGVYDIASVLGPGASGGPLLYTSDGVTSVVGVLSAGNDTASTYAGLFTESTWSWLHAEMAANDSLLGYPPVSAPADGTVYTGTIALDNFTGTAGRDTFNGRAGNDTFDGAGDIDVALYIGARDTYQVTVTADGIQVRDTVAGRDGTDVLHNVERLNFADVDMAFDTSGHAGQAYRLYQAAFDRAPDIPGLGFHINDLDNGLYIGSAAAHFIASPEFQAKYGSLSNEQFVRQLYLNVLHREPEAAGLAYHVHNLETTHQRSDVLAGFSESPENQANVIGSIQNGMVYTF